MGNTKNRSLLFLVNGASLVLLIGCGGRQEPVPVPPEKWRPGPVIGVPLEPPASCTSATFEVESLPTMLPPCDYDSYTSLRLHRGVVHVTYWRGAFSSKEPIKMGCPVGTVPGLTYAVSQGDTFRTMAIGETSEGFSVGHEAAMVLDAGGMPHIASARFGMIFYSQLAELEPAWHWRSSLIKKAEEDLAVQQPPMPHLWLALNEAGSSVLAWANPVAIDKMGYAVKARDSSGWETAWLSLPGLDPLEGSVLPSPGLGVASYRAAIDGQGRIHHAWVNTAQTMGGEKPTTYLTYSAPGHAGSDIASSVGDFFHLADLVVDGQGHAHLLYFDAQHQVFYATNASGDWAQEQIERRSFRKEPPDLVVDGLALAVDEAGRPYAALSVGLEGGDRYYLEVHSRAGGSWRYLGQGAASTGAFALAAESGVAYLAFFGEEAFKVERLCSAE